MREVEANGVIFDIKSQKDKLLTKAAETVAAFVETRGEEGKLRGVHSELLNMLSIFSAEEQTKILAMALEYHAKKTPSTGAPKGGTFQGSKPMHNKKKNGSFYNPGW